jgi:hypothetical protein
MIIIEKWAGLVTNASPYVIPHGAAVTQVNLQAIVAGQVSVRPGHNAMSFSSLTAGTAPIRSAIRYPDGNAIVFQDAAGAVRVGVGPS